MGLKRKRYEKGQTVILSQFAGEQRQATILDVRRTELVVRDVYGFRYEVKKRSVTRP